MESLALQCSWSLTVSVEPRPSVQGDFLKETRFCGLYKTTRRNKTVKKGIIMHCDAQKHNKCRNKGY